MMKIWFNIFILCAFATTSQAMGKKFTLPLHMHVVDDAGNPVPDAQVSVSFRQNRSHQSGNAKLIKGNTNEDGVFIAEDITMGMVPFFVRKAGFYESRDAFLAFFKNPGEDFIRPYDPSEVPVKVIMRPKLSPIPMFVKKVEATIPQLNKFVGYDLKKGDWVKPYGNGEVSDLSFEASKNVQELYREFSGKLNLKFLSEQNGIIEYKTDPKRGSKLRLPNLAPENGYQNEWKHSFIYSAKKEISKGRGGRDNENCFFRIRTVTDEEGRIESCYYGKIYGPIKYGVQVPETATIRFQYYLNPNPNDRNVEFDPNKNLFGGSDKFAP